jgi:hypothetical protein
LKKQALLFAFVSILLVAAMFSTASATPTKSKDKDAAVGGGVFVHEHDGVPHTHYFAFSVSEGPRNIPQGTFHLICKHDGQIDTIIASTKITSLTVMAVSDGLAAVFTGTVLVKMNNAAWEKGWTFTVTAYDLDSGSTDLIGVTLVNPQGQVQCSAEPTPLSTGNIIIKN